LREATEAARDEHGAALVAEVADAEAKGEAPPGWRLAPADLNDSSKAEKVE
jgi:hypothetical protein